MYVLYMLINYDRYIILFVNCVQLEQFKMECNGIYENL